MIRHLIAASVLALLAACGGSGGSGNETAATSFITPGADVPETAERGEDGVPRDDYGRPYDYAFLGREIPAFDGTMVAGPLFSTQELENQWTLIIVWGLHCHDSRADADLISELWTEVKDREDLALLTIHTPASAERADEAYGKYNAIEDFFEEKGFNFPTLVDEDASIRETLKIAWTPSYLLIAPDLTVQGFRSNLSDAEADNPVEGLLADIKAVQSDWEPLADEDKPAEY
ncbi:MAG: redoxin domain-containing protein [Henriciella sp.]|uniref:TlpA family protein disulfide reductase n=1 Tax=Henriciella sp. TaxID=1968823 RepID=UPI0032EF2681